jgi:hypothetical protein
MMVLSPWVVRNIRFDESLGLTLHGYDFDLCQQVRAAGRRVTAEDLRVFHHHSLALIDDPQPYVEAHMKLTEKWEGRIPGPKAGAPPADWKLRARRAEAEAAATRTQARSWQLQIDARTRRHEFALREMAVSTSMRVTAPLRRLSGLRRTTRGAPPLIAERGDAGDVRTRSPMPGSVPGTADIEPPHVAGTGESRGHAGSGVRGLAQ